MDWIYSYVSINGQTSDGPRDLETWRNLENYALIVTEPAIECVCVWSGSSLKECAE
jgi:hypothetical protein